MDVSEISETDRELILKFANAMRDLDVLTILAKPGRSVSESEKQERVISHIKFAICASGETLAA
jgi:hypothetical protein